MCYWLFKIETKVLFGSQWQDGAGLTTGEEMETAFQHLSRCGSTTKNMTRAGWCIIYFNLSVTRINQLWFILCSCLCQNIICSITYKQTNVSLKTLISFYDVWSIWQNMSCSGMKERYFPCLNTYHYVMWRFAFVFYTTLVRSVCGHYPGPKLRPHAVTVQFTKLKYSKWEQYPAWDSFIFSLFPTGEKHSYNRCWGQITVGVLMCSLQVTNHQQCKYLFVRSFINLFTQSVFCLFINNSPVVIYLAIPYSLWLFFVDP